MDRKFNILTPARNRENIGIGLQFNSGLKDNLASGRKHNNPKQAFGELKNIFHNNEIGTKKLGGRGAINKNISKKSETPKCLNLDSEKLKTKPFAFKPENNFDDEFTFLPEAEDPDLVWMNDISSKINDALLKSSRSRKHPLSDEDYEKIFKYEYGIENSNFYHGEILEQLDEISMEEPFTPIKELELAPLPELEALPSLESDDELFESRFESSPKKLTLKTHILPEKNIDLDESCLFDDFEKLDFLW